MKILSNRLFTNQKLVKYGMSNHKENEYILLQFVYSDVKGMIGICEEIHGENKGKIKQFPINDLYIIYPEDK